MRLVSLLSFLCLGFLTSGCGLLSLGQEFRSLGQEIEELGQWAQIKGATKGPETQKRPTQMLLYRLQDLGPTLVDYKVQLHPGAFEFNVRPGSYYIAAFEDLNADYMRQSGEPLGYVGLESALRVGAGDIIDGVDVVMRKETPLRGRLALDLTGRNQDRNLPPFRRNVGVVADLDDPRFSSRRGQQAFTRPEEFIDSGAVGIFLEEPYDPGRIPVLFVHGINGSPQDLRPIIATLDREKFQVWFVAYPSALRLAVISRFVEFAINELTVTYQLPRLYVVAHSMGGLVSRAFINSVAAKEAEEIVRVFVTLATPFRGSEAAELTQAAPSGLLPPWINSVSWIDMVPNSHFQKQLFATPLSALTEHHLFFAYQPGEATDGAVSILSQLDPRAEDGARSVMSANATHSGIVSDERVQKRLQSILDAAWGRDRGALRPDAYVGKTAVGLAGADDFEFAWTETEASDEKRRERLDRLVRDAINKLRALVASPEVLRAIGAANAAKLSEPEILDRDVAWSSGVPGSHLSALTDAACNGFLAGFVAQNPQITEIIATGTQGVNVCQSNHTADYLQADEAWWQRTWQIQRPWRDTLAYDESANAFGLTLHLPVRKPGQGGKAPIGVVKALLRAE